MKQENIKILKVETGKEPYVKEIENTLNRLQKEVGGLIQVVDLGENCLAIINEEGKLNGSLPNRWLGNHDIICGDFFICGDGGEDFISLSDKQIELCSNHFKDIPDFKGDEQELEPRAFVIGFDAHDM